MFHKLICFIFGHRSEGRLLWWICDRCGNEAPEGTLNADYDTMGEKKVTYWRGGKPLAFVCDCRFHEDARTGRHALSCMTMNQYHKKAS